MSDLWPDVPATVDALVAQMLAKDPALRPSDGANLVAALAALGPLAHTALEAPRERAASPRATTVGERRLLAVVMLGPTAQDDGLTEPLEQDRRDSRDSEHGGQREQEVVGVWHGLGPGMGLGCAGRPSLEEPDAWLRDYLGIGRVPLL